ncbi:MAG: HD-GYP domain-containing protein [Fervidobacterium sp.]
MEHNTVYTLFNATLVSFLIISVVLNVFLLIKMRKKNKKMIHFAKQLQKFKDLSTKFRDIVVQREEVFYKNIHEISLNFLDDVKNSVLITFEGEEGKIVSVRGSNPRLTKIEHARVKKSDLPFSAERVYVVDKRQLKNIIENYAGDEFRDKIYIDNILDVDKKLERDFDGGQSKLLISDIHIGGELKAKLIVERDKPFVTEEIETVKSLSGFFTSFIATHNYLSSQGKFQKDMILTIIRILEYHDPYTKGHSRNVANLSSLLAEKLGLPDSTIKKTYWAGLVHDIGKIVVPSSILNKEGKLTLEEFEVIKKHPAYGHDFLSTSSELRELARYVLHHHERWDGKGYPSGLSGDEIPLISRIITVVDAWDAMTSDRPYRKGLSLEQAKQELIEHSGMQFDPNIVKVFVELIEKESLKKLIN